MKLLTNLPIDKLTPENDYLGVIEKGDAIVSLLESGNIEFDKMKMFALYGNWGSGKSTLMKYIQGKLNEDFNSFYFDAWQYENGRDLSFSLLEFLADEGLSKGEKVATDILKTAEKVLVGAAKSLSLSIPGLTMNPKELIEELEKEPKTTFHNEIQNFKKEFSILENKLLTSSKPHKKTNIVFIDDLDRCEPDKVLDLLSEIKLFFTYGERTIFFFGVDEKAVHDAIKNKYVNAVKSSEYLEKVFDLTFHLREDLNISKMVSMSFPDVKLNCFKGIVSYQNYLTHFFQLLQLNNPRKLKKLINAYAIYANTIEKRGLNGNHKLITFDNPDGSYLTTIITLFLIAQRLFEPEMFTEFGNRSSLISSYTKDIAANHNNSQSNKNDSMLSMINYNGYYAQIYYFLSVKNKGAIHELNTMRINDTRFGNFTIMFAPRNVISFQPGDFYDIKSFQRNFSVKRKTLNYYMIWYLNVRIHKHYLIDEENIETHLSPLDIKSYIKSIL